MVIEKVLSGNYLKERSKITLLLTTVPFLLVILLTLLLDGLIGNHLLVRIISMGVISFLLMVPIIIVRRDEVAAAFCIVVQIYVDFYLGTRFIGLGLVILLLLVRYLTRSPRHPWILPRWRWFWVLLLGVAIFPALRGYTLASGVSYYLTILFAAFLFFWLGNVLAQDMTGVRRFFSILAAVSTLLAIITLVQLLTGKLLFYSPRYAQFMEQVGDFQLFTGSSIYRIGGLFVNPDWNGAFLALVVFFPLSLFCVSSTLRLKAVYLAEVLLILLALLATYTTGAWIAAIAGIFVFLALIGNMRSRLFFVGFIALISLVLLIFFQSQLIHQFQHASSVTDFMIRVTAWQMGIRVIEAFPLTGIGMGLYAYLYRAQVYHIASPYYRELGTPLNSYLEIPTMGGLPLGIVFLALLSLALWWAWRNWKQAKAQNRMLLAGGIATVVALSINSLGNQGWTIAPLAALGWLILGMLSSPLLAKSLQHPAGHAATKQETYEKNQLSQGE